MNKTLKSALLSASVLLIGSSVFASNMGFKLVYPLTATVVGVTDGTNYVAIPYFNSFATQNAAGVFADIPSVQSVSRWNQATSSTQRCSNATCTAPGNTNFALTEGEALIVRVSAAANWTIVGSHDNAYAVPLSATVVGVTDGTNTISVPYHTNKTNAAGLFGEITSIQSISRWNQATSSTQRCSNATCTAPGNTNFPVTIGEGLIIRVSAASTWTPAHY
jgi:hypothetical protein